MTMLGLDSSSSQEGLSDGIVPLGDPVTIPVELRQVSTVQRRVIPAVEQQAVAISLSDLLVDGKLDLYEEVIGKDYFRMYLSKNNLVFQAGSFVGLIPINDR